MRVPTGRNTCNYNWDKCYEVKEERCYMKANSPGPNLDGRATMPLNKWYLTEIQRMRN